ncbi:anthrax toxin receptor-like [Acomys russatus]|uniref:anthrax toxin receptor-like n=1 Tax=Acomys russatus TaxID=60746 RepID=UPI0021E2CC12|nr:anthrax toxin receptor-like [Acomys russatus]
MQDFGPQVSCLVHLLLLLLSTSLVGGQSFPYPQSGQNPYHRELALFHSYEDWGSRQAGEKKEEDILQYCDGDLDVYFVLDKSSAVKEWNDVFSSWEDMVEKYLNPNMRMSFIFFDYRGVVKMPLTSDRREIRHMLSSIQTIQLAGSTLLHKGLEKANEQIQTANSGAASNMPLFAFLSATTRSSLIIAVFWGQLSQQELDKSKEEADKARTMGAYVYCIGLDYNDKKKLNEITDNEENVFVLEGASNLFHGLVDTPPKALPAPAPQSQPTEKDTPPPPVPPPVPPSVPAPAPPVNVSPIVIICCGCCCRNVYVSRGTEGNVTVCNFSPLSCHQLPVMWSQSTDQQSHRDSQEHSHSPPMPCSAAALFLLLLLWPPPIVKAGGLRYHGPGWKLFHRMGKGSRSSHQRQIQHMRQDWSQDASVEGCQGVFDLYFILDKSGSVGNNWNHIYSFMESLVKKFQNPKLRMSFITYSTDANVVLPLTSDREEIYKALGKLQKMEPRGLTYMQKGFIKANEQIRKTASRGSNVNSVIIALTDGILMIQPFQETMEEADKARKMGAIVYTVGVHLYNKWQMLDIADSKNHTFGVDEGFPALQGIIDTLAYRSCTEILSVQPSFVCAKESYQVNISGHGFHNAKDMIQVICRFTFSDSRVVDESPSDMSDHRIICPGPKIQHTGEEVFLQVSLNNGISFIGNKLVITSTSCGSTRGDTSSQRQAEDIDDEESEGHFDFDWKLLIFLPVLLVALLLLYGCWMFFSRKPKKSKQKQQQQQPPPPQPEKKPEEETLPSPSTSPGASPPPPLPLPPPPAPALSQVNPNPTVIVSCCGCGNRGVQGNMDTCCSYLHPSCHQVPLMCCHPKVQGRCANFTLMNPSCSQASCSQKVCLCSNRDCFRLTHPPCASRIVLQPSEDCFNNPPRATCRSKVCFQANGESLPPARMQCSKMCPPPDQEHHTLNYSQSLCPTKSLSRMLPLLPPQARQSVESLCHTCPNRPTSKRLKF